jgi:hypothetical protein
MTGTFDLLSAVALTFSAAILVATVAIGFGDSATLRLRIAASLAAWFVVVVILAATRALYYTNPLGTNGIGVGVAVLLPVVILCLVVMRSERLRRMLETVPLSLLIGVNFIRVLGVLFLLLHASGQLPAPFAPSAGWGDIIAGVAAVPVAWLAQRQGRDARPIILAWNIFGIADLLNAIGMGVTSSPGPLQVFGGVPGAAMMATLPWLLIPAFLVPLLICTHLAVFWRLLRREHAATGMQIA